MNGRWRYRIASVVGTIFLTAGAVALVNNTVVLSWASIVPVLSQLPMESPSGPELLWEILTATVVVFVTMVPLYKPRPRRILDTIAVCQRRVLLAMVALAAIGYFDYTYRLPRMTVLLASPMLLVVLPAWFVWIRRRPAKESKRAVVIGDDREQIESVVDQADSTLFGYLCPTRVQAVEGTKTVSPIADGGRMLGRIGGLSRIEEVFIDYDIDTAFLAFERADRAEFFGALDACFEHGIDAKVHRDHAANVLSSSKSTGTFVDVEVEPWDVQDYIIKRGFDVGFSLVTLLLLTPFIVVIIAAIRLEGNGPVFFSQRRTYLFGETFTVYKFRTLTHDSDGLVGTTIDENRHTPLGRFLRSTHLDEVPQLWSILVGDMSVVGPRPAQTDIEDDFEAEAVNWRRRWFVKPGLTGLAQINGATSQEPREKLHYDMQYVRNQSLRLDLKIVVRQIWQVFADVASLRND